MREASFLYAELVTMGAPMGFCDVGGGLAVDYAVRMSTGRDAPQQLLSVSCLNHTWSRYIERSTAMVLCMAHEPSAQ